MSNENIVMLHNEQHRDLKVKPIYDATPLAEEQFIPIIAQEFSAFAASLPIVWVKTKDSDVFQVGVLTSFESGKNACVNDGNWEFGPRPAIIAHRPFVLISTDENNASIGFNQASPLIDDEGQRVFNDDGTETPLLEALKTSLAGYYDGAQMTTMFTKHIEELGLFQERSLNVVVDGEKKVIDGIHIIDEKRLNELSDEQFLDLRQRGMLLLIYSHLLSLQQVKNLAR